MEPVATFWRGLTGGSAYVRCDLPAKHLPGRSLSFKPAMLQNERITAQDGNTAVWQHPGFHTQAVMMADQQNDGVRCYVESDDNYLVPVPANSVYKSAWVPHIHDDLASPSVEAHQRIVQQADGVIVSTDWLGEQYREWHDNVHVCPNAVDPADWPEPQPYDGTLRIGWAASDSHYPDAPLVRRALQWASKQPNVEVCCYGNLFHLLRQTGEWRFKFKVATWTDTIADYRYNLGFLDVALCPLKDNEWSRGKSDLKALEASMAGALPIVSRAEAYRPWWQEKMPCLVAESAGGFEEAVRWCVQNRDEVQQLAADAREYVLRDRSFPLAVMPWREAVAAAAPKPELVLA